MDFKNIEFYIFYSIFISETDDLAVKNTLYASRGLEFNFYHPHGS